MKHHHHRDVILNHRDVILSEAKDLARERLDLGGEDPLAPPGAGSSVAALPQDNRSPAHYLTPTISRTRAAVPGAKTFRIK